MKLLKDFRLVNTVTTNFLVIFTAKQYFKEGTRKARIVHIPGVVVGHGEISVEEIQGCNVYFLVYDKNY